MLGVHCSCTSCFEKFPNYFYVHETFTYPVNAVVMHDKLDIKVREKYIVVIRPIILYFS